MDSHQTVLLPGLFLQHDDPVRRLVQSGRQSLPLALEEFDSALKIEFPLSHKSDLLKGIKSQLKCHTQLLRFDLK